MMPGMVIDMEEARLHTLAQVRAFLDGATEIAFRVPKVERYSFVGRVLMRFAYAAAGRVGKGVPLRYYLALLTGLSRQQVTRLVWRNRQEGTLSTRPGPLQHGFRRPSPPRTWPCWPTWTRGMAPCQDRPPRHCGNGPASCSGMRASSDWRAFRCPISTTFGEDPIPAPATALDPNAVHRRPHRPAPSAPAEWDARVYPDRQRASGRPRRDERGVDLPPILQTPPSGGAW